MKFQESRGVGIAKRTISFLLLSALLLVSVACGEQKQEEPNSSQAPIVTEAPAEGEQYSELEAGNYDTEFKILSSTVSEDGGRHFAEFGGDLTADSIASEIFKRDQYLQEKHNVTFEIRSTVNWNTELDQAHQNNQLVFHIATPGAANAVYSITKGYLANLEDFPHFDFKKPWWSENAIEQMSVVGKKMIVLGDVNLLAYDSVGVMFYSKTLAERLMITDLYDHVKAGTWTYEKMMEYVANVTADTGGENGVFDAGDTFGLTGGSYSALCFVYAGNYTFVEKDEDGIPVLKADLNDFITFFQDVVNDHARDYLIGYDNIKEDTNMFAEHRQLFNINMLGYSVDFRNDDINYGILPLPKWSVEQEDYWTFPHQSASTTICVPTINTEYDMTSRVVEDMAYLSYRDVLSKYIEDNLFFRSLNGDTDSYDTVLNLLRHLNCDIFFSYKAGITQKLRDWMDLHQSAVASQFARYQSSFEKQLGLIVSGATKGETS